MEAKEPPEREPDGQPRWRRTLYVMWVAEFVAIAGFTFVMPFIPFYIRELGVTDEQLVPLWAGILATAPAACMVIFCPIWGSLADKYGRKLMVMRAMFGGAVLITGMGLVSNVYQLLVLRLLQGAITGTMVAATTLVSSVSPSRRLGYSMGIMQTGVFVGAAVGPWIGGIVADHLGYRIPFYIAGGLLLAGGCTALLGVQENFSRPTPEEEKANGTLRAVANHHGFSAILVVFFLFSLGTTIVAPIFPLFVEKIVGAGGPVASTTGLMIGITGLVAGISATIIGRLGDRMGHKQLLTVSTLVSGLASIPHALVRTVDQLIGLRVLFGMGVGGAQPIINTIIGKITPRNSYGKAYGLTFSAGTLGSVVGPLVGGLVASQLGLRLPFVIMGGLLIAISLVVALRVKEA